MTKRNLLSTGQSMSLGTEDLQQAQRLELQKLADIEDQIREFATLLSLANASEDDDSGRQRASGTRASGSGRRNH
jgi:hypothetical protein